MSPYKWVQVHKTARVVLLLAAIGVGQHPEALRKVAFSTIDFHHFLSFLQLWKMGMLGRNNLAFKSKSLNRLIVEFLLNSNTSASTTAGDIACGGSCCHNSQHFFFVIALQLT